MIRNTDESYWAKYYKSGAAPHDPSVFAQYVMGKHVHKGHLLMELGCGNGRDAHFFAQNGVNVMAVDQCAAEIDELVKTNGQYHNLRYQAGDFTELADSDNKFDLIYSRFTLHSVSAEGQQRTLDWCYRNLVTGGLLCIETRGQRNELYGKGEPVAGEPDAFIYDNHYRRFVDYDTFKDEIAATGFAIIEGSEQTGFAPFENTDYHFIRIIAQK